MSRGSLRNPRYLIICLALAAGAFDVAHADSMRCGKWVVSESVTLDELVKKCGQPISRDVTKDEIYLTNANGMRVKTGNFTVTERWIYQPTSGKLPMAVVIRDGKIVSLTRASR
ncbi:DUF2845 domain-containing protein [Steroidobacter sp. S1-65]|uniref:DUF2845 domain-containing protein n=1 Tax=Steroidobacter gossypii TaxID=2805490 RepID=A0ABS1X212_9GAMM|nr:DUF2845 domain-containing protein [Steroidobacter gossypii]MBM0107234.1 DUF2845 domain-containing protein [Steroidobacter gossypii]